MRVNRTGANISWLVFPSARTALYRRKMFQAMMWALNRWNTRYVIVKQVASLFKQLIGLIWQQYRSLNKLVRLLL